MNRRIFFSILSNTLTAVLGSVYLPKTSIKPLVLSPTVGFKGTVFLEAGCVYAPYIPLYRTSTVLTKDGISKIK